MKFKISLLLICCNVLFTFSQTVLAKKGTITLANNQVIVFNNVVLEGGKFNFFDVKSAKESSLALNEIQFIEDEQNSRVFTNKKAVDKAKQESLLLEEEKKKEIARKQAEFQKKLEEEKKAPALGIYPVGIYITKEDFLKMTPSNTEEVIPKELYGFEKDTIYGIPDDCFFYYSKTNKKVKNCFAVAYRGHLYFQIQAILENRNKTDRAQSNDLPNSFVRVQKYGQNYFYLEADLANYWAQGFAYGVVGGGTGAILANSMVNHKGVVWDIKNKVFNIFKNCKDFNEFIKDKYPQRVQKCENQQADIQLVRNVIEAIK